MDLSEGSDKAGNNSIDLFRNLCKRSGSQLKVLCINSYKIKSVNELSMILKNMPTLFLSHIALDSSGDIVEPIVMDQLKQLRFIESDCKFLQCLTVPKLTELFFGVIYKNVEHAA